MRWMRSARVRSGAARIDSASSSVCGSFRAGAVCAANSFEVPRPSFDRLGDARVTSSDRGTGLDAELEQPLRERVANEPSDAVLPELCLMADEIMGRRFHLD